ncbi:MAG: hypothetical protein CMH70_08025 [Nitrosomonadaceae bacterium]|nr:hypothetical protein [Nitrosomonadaceae bacterium]|tara:strand:- start:478 stop:1617 length:1140 start_codon:yes stop_codon:yes gene_type:complete
MKNDFRTIILSVAAMLLVGCATTQPTSSNFNAKQLSTANYAKKADTFVIIHDGSSSMAGNYIGRPKIDISREILSNMNQTIPQLDFNAGLVSFGSGVNVHFGLTDHNRDGLSKVIEGLTSASGPSPMDEGIRTTSNKFLRGLGLGKISMFIISDGISDVSNSGGPNERRAAITAAKKIKDQLGNRVCIYPIQIGNEPGGKEFMSELAKVGGCGFLTNHKHISSPDSMASFVIMTLLGPIETPAPAPVLTPKTSPKKITFSADALFDFDGFILRKEGKESLDNLMTKIDKLKYDMIIAIGYTDRIGSENYNKKLSMKRAEVVRDYLVSSHDIDPNNIFIDGKGEANPITGDKCTGKGKSLKDCLQPDRRVEIEIAGIRKE